MFTHKLYLHGKAFFFTLNRRHLNIHNTLIGRNPTHNAPFLAFVRPISVFMIS